MSERFSRSAALLGSAAMTRLHAAHVLVVGVGGVGSWCAEALVRTGVKSLAIMDDDLVAESNLNRQCPATAATLGQRKVDALRDRLLAINPECAIEARGERYASGATWGARQPDAIVDAIDSVDAKAELILAATEAKIPLFSSMGAALRQDPTRVKATRFEKVTGDGLAKALRQRFKTMTRFPAGKFTCVWSEEPPLTAPIRGSLMTVTATFGMVLAAEVIRHLTQESV